MPIAVYEQDQGTDLIIDAVVRDRDGQAIRTYAGTEPLSTQVWQGDNQAASFSAATAWTNVAAGAIAIAITASQSSTLVPGRYELMTKLDDRGTIGTAYRAYVDILPAPGGIVTRKPPTILSPSEAASGIPHFDPAATGSLQLLHDATDAIQEACARVFTLGTYAEAHRPGRGGWIGLGQYPLRRVLRVAAGRSVALRAWNPTLRRPTATLAPSLGYDDPASTPASVALAGYAAGAMVAASVDLATAPTVADAADAINLAGHGWAAAVADAALADLPASDLLPDWDARPAGATASDGAAFWVPAREGRVLDARRDAGRIRVDCGGAGEVVVVYEAGYDASTMPPSLKRCCAILVKAMAQKTATGMTAQSKSGDQFSIVTGDVLKTVASLWSPYRRLETY